MASFNEFLEQYGWLVIFAIIIIFTVLTMLYYSRKDKYDPEPPGRLIFAFLLGIVSVIPALILSFVGLIIISFGAGGAILNLLTSILIAPVAEEIAKLWFVIYLARSDTFDGPLDGLVYGAMVGAGFAAAENVLYAFGTTITSGSIASGVTLTAFRSLLLIVGHPLYTGLAGVGVGEWKVGLESGKYNKIWRSMLFHGLWNLSANLNPLMLLIGGLIVVIILNVYVLRKELNRTLELDRDAFERGYYDQKQKMLEEKRQKLKQQINTMSQDPSQFSQHRSDPIPWQQAGPAKDQSSGPNFCKQCGTRRQGGDIYCRNCGFKLV